MTIVETSPKLPPPPPREFVITLDETTLRYLMFLASGRPTDFAAQLKDEFQKALA